MAIHYRNPQTGEYEVIKIPVMRGEQGHSGIHVGSDEPPTTDVKLWFDPSDTENDVDLANRLDTTLTACYDYMGNDRGSIKAAADANVDWLLGEINAVHYDGQYITATDTIEGRSKSAILKGNTMVNLINYKGNFDGREIISDNTFKIDATKPFQELIIGKEYTFITYVSQTQVGNMSVVAIEFNEKDTGIKKALCTINNPINGVNKVKFTVPSNYGSYLHSYIKTTSVGGSVTVKGMVIEGDRTQEDIPHFTGMQSVKMPVLRTTGKNLFDGEFDLKISSSHAWSKNFIKVLPNTAYIFSHQGTDSGKKVDRTEYYNEKFELIGYQGINNEVTTPNDCHYIKFRYHLMDQDLSKVENTQLEQGTVATSYEPFKSNILTVNEDVTLRGIGDVKDTLDCLTGEVVQRIGEYTIDGNENWEIYENFNVDGHKSFITTISGLSNLYTNSISFISGDFKTGSWNDYVGKKAEEMVWNHDPNKIGIKVKNETASNVTELKAYLASNPIRFNYQLATPIIKTVDLSDNHVYSYKDVTHYDCSSAEGSLVPTLSIDVPTNLSALVTKQRNQIETLKEENKGLNQELQLAITSSEENDNELLAQSFELDFRLMEVEFALDLPMAATFRLGGKAMAMTPYEMAKKLILAGNYERADMERKLDVYVSKKRMTEAERQELIQLMNEKEGIITTDPIESEVEETDAEHEAVTIPLH